MPHKVSAGMMMAALSQNRVIVVSFLSVMALKAQYESLTCCGTTVAKLWLVDDRLMRLDVSISEYFDDATE